MTIVLFEDQQVTQLYPVTVGRPAFTISCASYRLLDLLSGWGHDVCALVRPHLRAVQQADFPEMGFPHTGVPQAGVPQTGGPAPSAAGSKQPDKLVALVNARLVPSATVAGRI
jgi:hypothetical protein